ncbi:hypothetical protein Dimus_014381 [Dionaea muscipula]
MEITGVMWFELKKLLRSKLPNLKPFCASGWNSKENHRHRHEVPLACSQPGLLLHPASLLDLTGQPYRHSGLTMESRLIQTPFDLPPINQHDYILLKCQCKLGCLDEYLLHITLLHLEEKGEHIMMGTPTKAKLEHGCVDEDAGARDVVENAVGVGGRGIEVCALADEERNPKAGVNCHGGLRMMRAWSCFRWHWLLILDAMTVKYCDMT